MGTIGGLVVFVVVAAVLGFVVGWFFARARREADGSAHRPPTGDDSGSGVNKNDLRFARLKADYARRVEVFSKREAELIAAGRKVVDQLRQREAELAELHGAGVASDDPGAASRSVGPGSPATAEVSIADDEPPLSPSNGSAPSAATQAPTELTRRRGRRAVIDPATGRPLEAAEPEVGAGHRAGVPPAELSVRRIAPEPRRNEPRVIDLRGQRQPGSPSADATTPPGGTGELIDIAGIGPKTADQLRKAGVSSLVDLACLDPGGPLPTSIEGLRGRLQRGDWVGQARRLIE